MGKQGIFHHKGDLKFKSISGELFPGLPSKQLALVVKLTFQGNFRPLEIGQYDQLKTKIYYYIGNDPSYWRSNIPTYQRVRYQFKDGFLDITTSGGKWSWKWEKAIPSFYYSMLNQNYEIGNDLILQIEGAEKISVRANQFLELFSSKGMYRLPLPISHRMIKIITKNADEISTINVYPSRFLELPYALDVDHLAIEDTLLYSSYLGGENDEIGYGISVDVNAAVFVAGATNSTDFPITSGVYDDSSNGNWDVIVGKIDSTGSGLEFCTFIGGSNKDVGTDIELDIDGDIYVGGFTLSNNFPTTLDIFNNGDSLLIQLSPNGAILKNSILFGGSNIDFVNMIKYNEYRGCVFGRRNVFG